jgi:methylmalonyl-CoA mutase
MNPADKQTKLFEAFEPVSKEAWRKQILHDLKAATLEEKQALYGQKMIWHSEPAIAIDPFYTKEDIQTLPLPMVPASQPGWLTEELIPLSTEKSSNQIAREALTQGADALCFDLSKSDASAVNLSLLLQSIKLSDTPVSFVCNELPGSFIQHLHKIAPYLWKGSLNYDPLTWQSSSVLGIDVLAEAFRQTDAFPEFYPLTINSHSFYKAGVSTTQEIAYLLAAFIEYAHQLTERGMEAATIFNKTVLSVSVGTNFFMEMAKLRALRLLYEQLAAAYQVTNHKLFIQARVEFELNPEEDPYNNLIRSSLAGISAVLGGCQALRILPFNGKEDGPFARRIVRNISLILKEESHLAQVANMADGSYYIENLTYRLAQEAWRVFTEIEAEGGFLQAWKSWSGTRINRLK